jgi:hypothetical protein
MTTSIVLLMLCNVVTLLELMHIKSRLNKIEEDFGIGETTND